MSLSVCWSGRRKVGGLKRSDAPIQLLCAQPTNQPANRQPKTGSQMLRKPTPRLPCEKKEKIVGKQESFREKSKKRKMNSILAKRNPFEVD